MGNRTMEMDGNGLYEAVSTALLVGEYTDVPPTWLMLPDE